MNKVWIILKAQTIIGDDYPPTDISTAIATSYEEGIVKFNVKAKEMMDAFKVNFSKAHKVDNNLSFKQYREIGMAKSEFYDFGYSDYLSDGKIFSIRQNKPNDCNETIIKEDVLLLYSYNFSKDADVQLMTLNDDSEYVDSFYKSIS